MWSWESQKIIPQSFGSSENYSYLCGVFDNILFMKHYLSIFFIAIALSSIANAQECTVPVSVQLENYSRNTTKYGNDRRWVNLNSILERHGLTTEIHNTRVAVNLATITEDEYCSGSKRKMTVEIRFIDAYSGTTFYSTKLDNEYCVRYSEMEDRVADDLENPMPGLDSLVDTIRTCIINAFEVNTKHMAKLAHDYAIQGDHDIALFALVQYPSCCPSYSRIKNVMLAIFRDYMKKDHDALLDVAKSVWKNRKTDVDARFVVSLLNSVQFNGDEQRKADKLLRKVAREYPALDQKSNKDYLFDAELKEIALREARAIGIDYGASDNLFPESYHSSFASVTNMRYDYYYNHDDYYYKNYDCNFDYVVFDSMIHSY